MSGADKVQPQEIFLFVDDFVRLGGVGIEGDLASVAG
jgi:hypothetical protein